MEYPTDDRICDAHESNEKMQEKRTDHFINQSTIISMAQPNENMTGNFLSHSHHPRVDNLPDGGGLWGWKGGGWGGGEHNHSEKNTDNSVLPENGMTALENFMKLATENKSDVDRCGNKDKSQLSWQTQEEKSHEDQDIDDKSFQQRLCMEQIEDVSFGESQKTLESDETKSDSLDFLKTTDTAVGASSLGTDRVIKQESITTDYNSDASTTRDTVNNIIVENEEESQKVVADYKFRGDGGPAKVSPGTGSWCCRRGGTEQPTPEHLRDGCCQGLQTKDEMLADSPQRDELKSEGGPHSPRAPSTTTTTTKLQDHLDKLKNNVRTEVPDCNCFPADKCELQLRIPYHINTERTH